jgi:hypothetical protein
MKIIFLMVMILITSSVFCQEEPMFLDGRQEYIYYSSIEPITNKLIFKSEELLTAIHSGCLELEKISENSFVYYTRYNPECSFSNNEIPISYKSNENDSSTIRYFPLRKFIQPRITIGGVTEGEKVDSRRLDISLLFINNDFFLEETTSIVKSKISVFYKNNEKKPLIISLNGGKLDDKFKKLIQKNFNDIEMINLECLIQNTTLGYSSKIYSNFTF